MGQADTNAALAGSMGDAESRARAAVAGAKTLVIKIGSAVLAPGENPGLDGVMVERIAHGVAAAVALGRRIVLVSSGAVACGRERIAPGRSPKTIVEKQAAAAVGQAGLIAAWSAALQAAGAGPAGQVLVTAEDLEDRRRFLNARRTLEALLASGIVPVINENDSVAFDEIRLGDNDTLAARVAGLVDAEGLIVLSIADGVRADHGVGDVVPVVHDPAREAPALLGDAVSAVGTGGMATKLEAASLAARFGCPTVIASGREDGVLGRVLSGGRVGTAIPAGDARAPALRKKWLASARSPQGTLLVDVGAERALVERGASLLPVGLRDVRGEFERGSLVEIVGPHGDRLALGLSSYDAGDLHAICGRQAGDIEQVLGFRYCDEVVHRDDLVLTTSATREPPR
ncbi:MAG: glutamate 5-kinase [Planctomycetota bacterium]